MPASLWAHVIDDTALPKADRGWRLAASAAVLAPWSTQDWPAPSWPGVLVRGAQPPAQNGRLALEHATLDASLRLDGSWAVQATLGGHDREPAHWETARVAGRWSLGRGEVRASLGRDTVRAGPVIDQAGHYDELSQTPIAKLASTDGAWTDDGLRLGWHEVSGSDGLNAIELGLWRGRSFPGGAGGPAALTMHLQGRWHHLEANLLAGHFEPEGRGAAAHSAAGGGHSHGALDCRRSLQQRVCFEGRVDLLQGSLAWSTHDQRWQLRGALLAKRETGALASTSAAAGWQSTQWGGWADVRGPLRTGLRWLLRVEGLRSDQELAGPGAATLARAAGLEGAVHPWRSTFGLIQSLPQGWQLSGELGRERNGLGRNDFAVLRLVWRGQRIGQL
ncbi:MAG TPA: hypothetical protein VK195_02695 [Burkholderiaceae bacterium]|nr:hypothetical protein [Burkholderiaceae bacterium]